MQTKEQINEEFKILAKKLVSSSDANGKLNLTYPEAREIEKQLQKLAKQFYEN